MHLSINGREITKDPFIGHAHTFHQCGLVEKIQLTQQVDQVIHDPVDLHQNNGVKVFEDLSEPAVAEGGRDDRQHIITKTDGGMGDSRTGAHGRDPRHKLHPDLWMHLKNGRIQIVAGRIDGGITESGKGHIPALAENVKDPAGGILPRLEYLLVRLLAQLDLLHGEMELHNHFFVHLTHWQRLLHNGERRGMAMLQGLRGGNHRTVAKDF